MILTLKKIQHKGAERIGVSFPYSLEVNETMKLLGAVYSSTLRCWYFDYNATNYDLRIYSELLNKCAHAHAGHTHAIYVSRWMWVF